MYPVSRFPISLIYLMLCSTCMAQDKPERKNWFNDPFFQISSGIPSCPKPLGPMTTEAERNAEAHYRVERGTSCWMAGQCSKPNSYLYDAPIADALRQRFAQTNDFDNTSIWLIVQRRFVMVQGCIAQAKQAESIEAIIKATPDVERVIMQVSQAPYDNPPYTLADTSEADECQHALRY